jgi:hypothetical protein
MSRVIERISTVHSVAIGGGGCSRRIRFGRPRTTCEVPALVIDCDSGGCIGPDRAQGPALAGAHFAPISSMVSPCVRNWSTEPPGETTAVAYAAQRRAAYFWQQSSMVRPALRAPSVGGRHGLPSAQFHDSPPPSLLTTWLMGSTLNVGWARRRRWRGQSRPLTDGRVSGLADPFANRAIATFTIRAGMPSLLQKHYAASAKSAQGRLIGRCGMAIKSLGAPTRIGFGLLVHLERLCALRRERVQARCRRCACRAIGAFGECSGAFRQRSCWLEVSRRGRRFSVLPIARLVPFGRAAEDVP